MCTSVPVKLNVRRASVQRPATLELWNTTTNTQIGQTRVIPLDSGHVDIRKAMADAVGAQKVEVSTDRELRISIISPTLPPMNLVDLPGTIEYPADMKERTHGIVRQYINEKQDSSMFIAVIKAESGPRKCGVMQHVK